MGGGPLDQTDLAGSTTNAAFKEYVFFNGGWHTLSAWLSIGWPTLCNFVFSKGWDILCFVSRPRKPFTPSLQPFNHQSSPFPAKHLTC